MNWEGLNRRRFPRIMYPCMVKVFAQEEGQEVLLTHTENVGVGGCSIIVKKEIKLFSPISVELDLVDDEDHIVCSGHVVWIVRRKAIEAHKPMHYDIGIEFEDLKPKDKKRLETAIDSFIKKGYRIVKPVM